MIEALAVYSRQVRILESHYSYNMFADSKIFTKSLCEWCLQLNYGLALCVCYTWCWLWPRHMNGLTLRAAYRELNGKLSYLPSYFIYSYTSLPIIRNMLELKTAKQKKMVNYHCKLYTLLGLDTMVFIDKPSECYIVLVWQLFDSLHITVNV